MPPIGSGNQLLLFLLQALVLPLEIWTGFACLSNPCFNGVCMDDLNSTYFCYCIDGYTGIQCQTNWNDCWSSPCQNGGICIDRVASFNCSCPPGFVGNLCEEDFNECESNPCLNNGTCVDNTNSYTCNCIQGYSGVHCEVDEAVCNTTNETRCANGGICVEGPGDSFSCRCPPGWNSFLCETEIDECRSAPCKNGGVCLDLLADYSCACPFGYIGRNCEDTVQICSVNPCANGALCLLEDDHPVCYCVPDFHGDLCQFQYDECQIGPKCLNGGTCIDGIDDSKCSCPPNLTGVHCECLILKEGLDCTYISPKTTTEVSPNNSVTITKETTTAFLTLPTESRNYSEDATTIPTTVLTSPESRTESTSTLETETTSDYVSTITHFSTLETSDQTEPITVFLTTQEPTDLTWSTFSTFFPYSSSVPSMPTELSSGPTNPWTSTTYNGTRTTYFSTATMLSTSGESTTPPITTSVLPSSAFSPEGRASSETTTDLTWSQTQYTVTQETKSTKNGTIMTTTGGVTETTAEFSTETNGASKADEFTNPMSSTTPSTTTVADFTTTSTTTTDGSTETTTENIEGPFDCSKGVGCRNGGTCTYSTRDGYQCLCPFDTDGMYCEKLLGIQKAAFTGNSYLSHRLPSTTNISIEFEAKTLSKEGLWFYTHVDSAYMVLFTENGYLRFMFSCGYQTMLLSEVKVPVNNGFLVTVKAELEFSKDLKHCDASIKVNKSLSMTGDQIAVLDKFSRPTAWMYLGSLPQEVSTIVFPSSGFTGCMSKLKVSGKSRDIFKDAEDGFGVTECSSLACLSNPCSNGATCTSKGDQWFCSCKNGFLGNMCEISVCDDNPCLYGGTCIPFSGSGYICMCPFGKHGHFCENDLKITEPHFSSTIRGLSSYVAYPLPGGITETMELKFRFIPSTMDQISILMFIGQKGHHDFYSDHVSVSFVKGYIMLTWNLGSGPRRIFTTQPIAEGSRDYQVRVGRSGRKAWLYVENVGNVTGRSPGNLVQLDVSPILYLGGHDSKNFSILPHDLPLHSGFSGCIFDVELISGSVVIPLQGSRQTIGRAVGQCGTSECHEQSCRNSGACLHHSSTFMCLCQDSWFGPLCTSRYNPCDSVKTRCASSSTCVPLMGGYECDCPLGKTGRYCEKDEDITDVSLTGRRSYLSLQSPEFDSNRFSIELEARPLEDNGLLLFTERTGVHFVCLMMQSGVLELKIAAGRGQNNEPSTISSSKILIKGIWYKIQLGIFGRKAYLSVDNTMSTAVLNRDHGIDISKETIYVGGLPDLATLPTPATSSLPVPFKGCVRRFLLNSHQVPLTRTNILESRNINDCDGTPCGKDACLNGGSCWLDSFTKPHCICLPPFYGERCEKSPKCEDEMCRNVGKCNPESNQCSCQVGWTGAFCQNRISVTTPEFMENSYLVVRKTVDKKREAASSLELKTLYMNFTTVKKDALLLWSRKGNSFVGVGIEMGFLKVALADDRGRNSVEYPTYHPISDGLWHSIEVTFSPFLVKLDQNNFQARAKYRKAAAEEVHPLITDGLFYIGGLPSDSPISKETNGIFGENFQGCIEGFAANDNKIIRDFNSFDGRNIDMCKVL